MGSLGIDAVVSPRGITVSTILQHVRRGRIRSVHSLGEGFGEIIEADAPQTSRLVGVTLREVKPPDGVSIEALVRDGEEIIPRADHVAPTTDQNVLFSVETGRVPCRELV